MLNCGSLLLEEDAVPALCRTNFGKHRGKKIQVVLAEDAGYFLAFSVIASPCFRREASPRRL